MKNEIDIIEKYFRIKNTDSRCKYMGCYDLSPIILMINDKEEIVKELLIDNDCNFKSNILSFLERVITDFRKIMIEKDKKYTLYNDLYTDIKWVLKTFNEIDNKYTINNEELLKILLERV